LAIGAAKIFFIKESAINYTGFGGGGLPVKIQGVPYSSETAESKYENQTASSPTSVKEKGLK
jgi:hypothetical protein